MRIAALVVFTLVVTIVALVGPSLPTASVDPERGTESTAPRNVEASSRSSEVLVAFLSDEDVEAPPRVLRGHVVDGEGNAVAGALVEGRGGRHFTIATEPGVLTLHVDQGSLLSEPQTFVVADGEVVRARFVLKSLD